jgi:formylglycine-generating enzyme required for sulfatase activity
VYLDGRSDEQQQRDLLFASELAEDVGWMRLESGGTMFKNLRRDLAAALVPVMEGTTLPAKDRVQAGVYLGWLGDPRPGVCTLPPDMVRIEGGTFYIGNTKKDATYDREVNDQPLTLPAFEIACYPLTNAQWKLFIDEGYNPDAPWWDEAGRAWLREDGRTQPSFWNDERFGIARPNHPVVGISWYEAVAFCKWLSHTTGDDYCLPSEAEWEYAARRATRRTYPWGSQEPDAERANFDAVYNGTTAVGCFAPGVTPEYQIHDLAGNVFEWTRSEYREYPYETDDGREDMDNPAGKRFTLRGGGWLNQSYRLRASSRNYFAPDDLNNLVGCRLARRLPET